jgi:AmmeMemoRadiSam system protein B
MRIEPSCVGTLIPADAAALRRRVGELLRAAAPPPCRPKAIIVPHAAYDYSGPIAATGYACLGELAGTVRRVVVLGTCHRIRSEGLLTTTADSFLTPLGSVPVDKVAVERATRLSHVAIDNEVHAADHAVAVQLPLLQSALEEFRLVPFLVGACNAEDVAGVLELFWSGDETLIVVSSDLSHYLSYEEACQRDRQTAYAIVQCDAEAIGHQNACGHRAIAGLLIAARRHCLRVRQVDLRNSGDTSGTYDRVVGYGAFVFESGSTKMDDS